MIGGRPFFQPRRHMSELDLPLPANHGFLHVWGFKLKTPVIDCRAVRIPTNQCRQRADRDFVPSSSQYENDSVGGFRGWLKAGSSSHVIRTGGAKFLLSGIVLSRGFPLYGLELPSYRLENCVAGEFPQDFQL